MRDRRRCSDIVGRGPAGAENQEDVVKYMLLIFSNPGNPHFSGDELDAVGAEVGPWQSRGVNR